MEKENAVPAHEMLCAWIKGRKNFNQSSLAERLSVSRASVTYWCSGASPPNRKNAAKIDRMSKGAVPAELWPQRRTTGDSVGAKKLRAKMDGLMIGASEAARLSGMPQSTLVHILNGTQEMPSAASIEKINAGLKLELTRPMFRRKS